jgi:uncharacterized membrane protein
MKIKYLQKIIYIIFAFGILLFSFIMLTKVLPYLTFERAMNFLGTKPDEVLDKNHFMWAFYVHILSSLIVMPIGVLQFSTFIFQKNKKLHHNLGKIYILTILALAAPSGLILAAYANGGLAARVGFTLQSLVWWTVTMMAWREAEQKNWLNHTHAMIRSFAVTLAAMSLRTESYFMFYYLETKPIETYLTVTWLSWVGNLLIVEILIYAGLGRRLLKGFLN